jgi:hypothetical protein
MDQPESRQALEALANALPPDVQIVPVAARYGKGVTTATRLLRRLLEALGRGHYL